MKVDIEEYKKLMASTTQKIKEIDSHIQDFKERNEKLPEGVGFKLYMELEMYLGLLQYLEKITEE
jgi:hypothetical protein